MPPAQHLANGQAVLAKLRQNASVTDREINLAMQRLALIPSTSADAPAARETASAISYQSAINAEDRFRSGERIDPESIRSKFSAVSPSSQEYENAVAHVADFDYQAGAVLLARREGDGRAPADRSIIPDDVERYLQAVPKGAVNYSSAQNLLGRLKSDEARDRSSADADARVELAKEQKVLEDNTAPRLAYAKFMENNLLEQGMNVDVIASGPKSTTLTYRYVLVNKAFVYKVQHDTNFLEQCKKLGFRRVVLTDGYRENWTWDFSKQN